MVCVGYEADFQRDLARKLQGPHGKELVVNNEDLQEVHKSKTTSEAIGDATGESLTVDRRTRGRKQVSVQVPMDDY
jgi:hypothetical protein